MSELKAIFKTIDTLMQGCEIDYKELKSKNINALFFEDYSNQRIVNSFLFNFAKIQDKIGGKLFKKTLYELREIDDLSLPMKDVLNILEKLKLIDTIDDWDRLREIRTTLAHDYPFEIIERIENIQLTIESYELLKIIYSNLKKILDYNL